MPAADARSIQSYNRLLLLVAGLGGLLYGVDVGHHRRRVALPRGHLRPERQPAVYYCCRGSARKRDLHPVCRLASRLAGAKASHGDRRSNFCAQHPGHCSVPRLHCPVSGKAVTRRQRRPDRDRGPAVSGRMPLCPASRERHRSFPVAADPGHLSRRSHRHLLQLSRSWAASVHLRRRFIQRKRPGMAAHLLGVHAPRIALRRRCPVRGRITALALQAREKRVRSPGPAALTLATTG